MGDWNSEKVEPVRFITKNPSFDIITMDNDTVNGLGKILCFRGEICIVQITPLSYLVLIPWKQYCNSVGCN